MNNTYGSGFVRKIQAGVKHIKNEPIPMWMRINNLFDRTEEMRALSRGEFEIEWNQPIFFRQSEAPEPTFRFIPPHER